jgi:predicted PurR-regulated permease PerM
LVFGVMFGILGLALADPLVAMLKILLERRSERNTAASVVGEAGPLPKPPPAAVNPAA